MREGAVTRAFRIGRYHPVAVLMFNLLETCPRRVALSEASPRRRDARADAGEGS